MTLHHELASRHASAQHQLVACYVPCISSRDPFSQHLQTTVRNEMQKQLAEHRLQEAKRTTFLARAPLLQLASEILSLTLAATLPSPEANNSMDIWSRPLAQDKQFAGQVKKMCQRNKCPVSEHRFATEFNQIRRDSHEAVHASTWDSLIEEADQFMQSSCATPELRRQYKLAYWIVTHAKQFEQVFDSCVSNM